MFIQLDGQVIYYEKTGDGPNLILLHGNSEDHEVFDESVKELSKSFTVYTIDSRGHGNSATPNEFHYIDMAYDVINFIETLKIENPTIFGHSDGGIIALHVARLRNDLIHKIIVAGANLSPKGLKGNLVSEIKKAYKKSGKDPKIGLMLKEPNILECELKEITIPTLIVAGEKDSIKKSETQRIHKYIENSQLIILKGEDHGSYVIHSDKIVKIIKDFTK